MQWEWSQSVNIRSIWSQNLCCTYRWAPLKAATLSDKSSLNLVLHMTSLIQSVGRTHDFPYSISWPVESVPYVIGYAKKGQLAQITKKALLVWGKSAEFKLQNHLYLISVACSYRELSTANDRPRRVVALEKTLPNIEHYIPEISVRSACDRFNVICYKR